MFIIVRKKHIEDLRAEAEKTMTAAAKNQSMMMILIIVILMISLLNFKKLMDATHGE